MGLLNRIACGNLNKTHPEGEMAGHFGMFSLRKWQIGSSSCMQKLGA